MLLGMWNSFFSITEHRHFTIHYKLTNGLLATYANTHLCHLTSTQVPQQSVWARVWCALVLLKALSVMELTEFKQWKHHSLVCWQHISGQLDNIRARREAQLQHMPCIYGIYWSWVCLIYGQPMLTLRPYMLHTFTATAVFLANWWPLTAAVRKCPNCCWQVTWVTLSLSPTQTLSHAA